jgi:hypothetical protein
VAEYAWVASDPILLERILLNLVSNAVRYTEKGGVLITAGAAAICCASTCDSGPAFDDQRQRIFGEFYQPGPGPSSTGLGSVAIVDRLGELLATRWSLDPAPAAVALLGLGSIGCAHARRPKGTPRPRPSSIRRAANASS